MGTQTEKIKDFKHNWNFKIKWICGHQYVSWNTTNNPYKSENAIKFGCPYCGCKKGKLIYFKTKPFMSKSHRR